MIPSTWWWFLALAGLLLLVILRRTLRRSFRRLVWRQALRTRRELGFRLNPVTLTRKQRLKADLLADAELRARIAALAAETGREEASLLAEVSLYLDEIVPNFNLITTYTFGKRLAGWLLRTCYRVRIGRSACDQCTFCTELCPRYLLGHPIEPHRASLALKHILVARATKPLTAPLRSLEALFTGTQLTELPDLGSIVRVRREGVIHDSGQLQAATAGQEGGRIGEPALRVGRPRPDGGPEPAPSQSRAR